MTSALDASGRMRAALMHDKSSHRPKIAALLNADLKALREALNVLDRRIVENRDRLMPAIRLRLCEQTAAIFDAVRQLECETCATVATEERESGLYCENCDAHWRKCCNCKKDVHVSEVVVIEGTRTAAEFCPMCAPEGPEDFL
jgi:hypothetical protein